MNKFCQLCNLSELNKNIDNIHQNKIIERIVSDREYAKVYLQGFDLNTDKKKKVIGHIRIYGTFNFQKKKRENYKITVSDEENKPTFWCSCAEHKFNSKKNNTVCKHICFIVCKVLKILQLYFFDNKKLSKEHLNLLLEKFNKTSEFWNNDEYVKKIKKFTINNYKIFRNNINESCVFCYDDIDDNVDKNLIVSCPNCKNCFHTECKQIWLEERNTCFLCNNDCWKYYNRLCNGENEIVIE